MATSATRNDDLQFKNLFNVSRYSVVMTGGGTGIGFMITQTLVANGDVTKKDEIKRLAAEVEKHEPNGIHLLVNNAGVTRKDNIKYSNDSPDFKLLGYFLLCRNDSSKKGFPPSIINITSISGVMKGSSGGQVAYAASKAALLSLARMMATTFMKTKIRVNSIAPGIFPSEMTAVEPDEHNKSKLASWHLLNAQIVYSDGGNLSVSPACTQGKMPEVFTPF